MGAPVLSMFVLLGVNDLRDANLGIVRRIDLERNKVGVRSRRIML